VSGIGPSDFFQSCATLLTKSLGASWLVLSASSG
jgi:hypothetical protein